MINHNRIHVRVDFTSKGKIIPLSIIDGKGSQYVRKVNYSNYSLNYQGKDVIEFGCEMNDGQHRVIYFIPSDFIWYYTSVDHCLNERGNQ